MICNQKLQKQKSNDKMGTKENVCVYGPWKSCFVLRLYESTCASVNKGEGTLLDCKAWYKTGIEKRSQGINHGDGELDS